MTRREHDGPRRARWRERLLSSLQSRRRMLSWRCVPAGWMRMLRFGDDDAQPLRRGGGAGDDGVSRQTDVSSIAGTVAAGGESSSSQSPSQTLRCISVSKRADPYPTVYPNTTGRHAGAGATAERRVYSGAGCAHRRCGGGAAELGRGFLRERRGSQGGVQRLCGGHRQADVSPQSRLGAAEGSSRRAVHSSLGAAGCGACVAAGAVPLPGASRWTYWARVLGRLLHVMYEDHQPSSTYSAYLKTLPADIELPLMWTDEVRAVCAPNKHHNPSLDHASTR